MSARKAQKRRTKPVMGEVERDAEKAGFRIEDLPSQGRTIPEIGACAHDVKALASATLAAMGVNLHGDPPSPAKVLEHAIFNELATLEAVLVLTERAPEFGLDAKVGGLVERLVSDAYERLDHAASWARTLSAIHAKGVQS